MCWVQGQGREEEGEPDIVGCCKDKEWTIEPFKPAFIIQEAVLSSPLMRHDSTLTCSVE